MYHLAVVLEERDLVHRRLDTEHETVLVVHLEADLAPLVTDSHAIDPHTEVAADLFGRILRERAAQEGGDVRRFTVWIASRLR